MPLQLWPGSCLTCERKRHVTKPPTKTPSGLRHGTILHNEGPLSALSPTSLSSEGKPPRNTLVARTRITHSSLATGGLRHRDSRHSQFRRALLAMLSGALAMRPFRGGTTGLQLWRIVAARWHLSVKYFSGIPIRWRGLPIQVQAHTQGALYLLTNSPEGLRKQNLCLKAQYLWGSAQLQRTSWNWLSPLSLPHCSIPFSAQSYALYSPQLLTSWLLSNPNFHVQVRVPSESAPWGNWPKTGTSE